jgi:hypothetical protein
MEMNETSATIEGGEFLDQLSDYKSLNKNSSPWAWLIIRNLSYNSSVCNLDRSFTSSLRFHFCRHFFTAKLAFISQILHIVPHVYLSISMLELMSISQ